MEESKDNSLCLVAGMKHIERLVVIAMTVISTSNSISVNLKDV